MKKYIVRFYGWEEEMQGFNLSQEQVDKLEEAVSSGKYESIDSMGMNIEEIIDVDFFEGDAFSMSRANYVASTYICVYDEDENELFSFGLDEMSDIEDHIEDFDYEGVTQIEFIPEKGGVENVLFASASSKGGLYEFHIESDEVPKPEDFSIVTGIIEMLDVSYEFIEHVYFKGEKLEIEEWLDNRGKGIDISLTKLQDLYDFWEKNGIKNPYIE
jgi:hypothetical protein